MDSQEEITVPGVAKLLGHICGSIFVLFATLSGWLIYRIILNPVLPAIFVLLIILSMAYFFAITAIRLTTQKNPKIISRFGYALTCGLFFVSSILNVFLMYIEYSKSELTQVEGILWTLVAICSLGFSYQLYFCFKNFKP